ERHADRQIAEAIAVEVAGGERVAELVARLAAVLRIIGEEVALDEHLGGADQSEGRTAQPAAKPGTDMHEPGLRIGANLPEGHADHQIGRPVSIEVSSGQDGAVLLSRCWKKQRRIIGVKILNEVDFKELIPAPTEVDLDFSRARKIAARDEPW